MKRRIFSVLLSSALLLTALAGCGQGGEADPSGSPSDAESETATRDELIFVNYRDIRDLNPHLYAGEMYAQSILYDTLVSNTEDGYVGCLAEDWTISDDGRIYTFNIRDGVTFSDGTPCDANAILTNFNAILENRERHTWLEMMNLLVSVSAPDSDTFVIEMSEPYYPMLTELACIRPFAMISPNCMIDGSTMNGVNGYIGTGPYVLTDFVTDEYAVFERNENYWGEAPAIQKITVKVIPDNQTRIMALENEEIDLIFGKNMLDADAISQYVDSDRFTVSLSDPTSTRHIVLNTTHDILGDVAVRKALQHATNRQAISEGIFYGLEPAADTLYSPTVPYCDVDLEPYAYDTDEAARLLDEAGWVMGSDGVRAKNGQKLELDLLYNSDSVTEKTISEYLQSEYLKLGISLNIHGEEEQSYRDNMKAGNFDMVFNIIAPEIEVIALIREKRLSREEEISYLRSHGVDFDFKKAEYSINQGIWGTSVGGKETLTSSETLPEEAYPSQLKESKSRRITLTFEKGEFVGLDGKRFDDRIAAIQALQAVAAPYAIGRDMHVGDTIIGIKGRVGFEAAAPMIIIKAHHMLEKHTLTKWQLFWKDQIAAFYGNYLHEGQYYDPVMRDMEAMLESSQRTVSGDVYVDLHPYRFVVVGIKSEHDLMSNAFGAYGETMSDWTSDDVKGFGKIFGNQNKIWYKVNKGMK